ncbi:MAG: hypothetical protein GX488_08585 [Clostridiales bacterium]|nr:hypothetical protein [Clostridiales bacterium]
MKTCGSCFRYCEDWRDAEAKGYKRVNYYGCGEYYRKPRPGVKLHAIGVNCPDDTELRPDHPACEYHEYRWLWNLKTWWTWHFKTAVVSWYRRNIRVTLGRLRKPVPLEWQNSFDGMADRIIPNGEPVCPHCGEMPYIYKQFVFCGQRFLPIPDDSAVDNTAPQREMRVGEPIVFIDGICPNCGCSCGNGGYGPLRCRCGWVGDEPSVTLKEAINELWD